MVVSFTSGQVATSTSIYLNEENLTSATLTATSTGSVEYFMNASGNRDNFHTGDITNMTYTTGTVGSYSGYFDGTSSVNLGTSGDFYFNETDNFSISAWIYPETLDGTERNIISRYDGNVLGNWRLVVGASDLIYFYREDGVYAPVQTFDPITTGNWYHVVATYDGTDMKIYVSGSSAGTPVASGNIAADQSNLDCIIGARKTSGSLSNYFAGRIDELRVYNSALGTSDISTLYSNGNVQTNLVAKYSFEEGTGSTKLFDTSNWEKVTSGTAHSFTNTGSDLRWKAVEKGGSTAEISQIQITY